MQQQKIKGLDKDPNWFEHHCYWTWTLMFERQSYLFAFYNMPVIALSCDKDEAWEICDEWKKAFKKANIYYSDTVALTCNQKGNILAIGNRCHDCWGDVYQDKFTVKKFRDLKIDVSSLTGC